MQRNLKPPASSPPDADLMRCFDAIKANRLDKLAVYIEDTPALAHDALGCALVMRNKQAATYLLRHGAVLSETAKNPVFTKAVNEFRQRWKAQLFAGTAPAPAPEPKPEPARKHVALKLTGVFVLAAAAVFGAARYSAPDDHAYRAADTTTGLTQDEKALVTSIFGADLDPSLIQVRENTKTQKDAAASVSPDRPYVIDFWGKKFNDLDYARDSSGLNFRYFAHEVTHVWQFKKAAEGKPVTTECTKYDYKLDGNTGFKSYCLEQQAAIMGDYAARFYHRNKLAPQYNSNCTAQPRRGCDAGQDALLMKTVEDQFPQARATRLLLERAPGSA